MKRSEIILGIIRIPLDAIAVLAALLLAYWLRQQNIDLLPSIQLLVPQTTLPPPTVYLRLFVLPWAVTYVGVVASLGLYALRTTLGPWREMSRVLLATALWVALIVAWYFLIAQQLLFSRALLLQAAVLVTFFALTLRSLMLLLQRRLLRLGIGVRSVLSCGSMNLPEALREELMHDARYQYRGHIATRTEAMALHHGARIDLILHTDPNPTHGIAAELIDECRNHQIGYAYVPPLLTSIPHQLLTDHIGLLPILRFSPTPLDGWGRVWKRCFDLFLSTMFLILLSPLLLAIAGLVLLCSGWPIFYVSHRTGHHGEKSIPVLKFRTMCRDADARKHLLQPQNHRQDGPLFKVRHDPRVTRIGRPLRRYSLDELPQLLNVLVGHLSLVGPRPHLPEEVARYSDHDRRVFTVRPGLTGLAQISGRSDLTFDDEVRLDMRYIEDWSLLLDAWILWRTCFVMLLGRGGEE